MACVAELEARLCDVLVAQGGFSHKGVLLARCTVEVARGGDGSALALGELVCAGDGARWELGKDVMKKDEKGST